MTIAEAYSFFIHDRSVYVSSATLKKYDGDLKLFFDFLRDRTGEDVIRLSFPQDWNIYQEYILSLRGKVKNVTIRSYCRTVKAFLHWCYEEDHCPDYLKRVKLPSDDSAPKLPLYREEVKQLDAVFDLNTLQGRRNYCIVHLMLDCGLRTQEVVHLRCENVLHDKNVLQVIDSKGNKSRMTLIPDFLLDVISSYQEMSGVKSGLIFRSVRKDIPITGNLIKQLFQDLKRHSGISRLHAHLLRHTFATSYLMGGGNLEFLRVFMGHTDYAVTKMYSQLAAEYKMLGADIYRLDDIFFTRGY